MFKSLLLVCVAVCAVHAASAQPDTAAGRLLYDEGMRRLETKEYASALDAFKQALAKDPQHIDALYRAGWCCNELEQFDSAVTFLEKAVELSPGEAKIFFELGYARENLGNADAAIADYKKCLELYPDYAAAVLNIANLCYEQDRFAEALAYYEQYLVFETADNFYYYRAAWCANDLGEYDKALQYLDRYGPEEDEDIAKKYVETGYAHYQLGQDEAALAAYQSALSVIPDYGIAIRGIGNVYYDHLDDYDSARTWFELSMQKDEENSKTIYYKLAWIYNDKEMYDSAITLLQKAIDYDPEDPGAREEIGYALYMQGKTQDADQGRVEQVRQGQSFRCSFITVC